MVIKAIQYNRFGDEKVLDLVNITSELLKMNQVRVAVFAVGLNPIDYKTFEGAKPLRFLSFFDKIKTTKSLVGIKIIFISKRCC